MQQSKQPGCSCRYCHTVSHGKFCSSCGEKITAERLSLGTIFHEAFHFFTHLDHGFPYTLKKLVTAPGTMQREYVAGFRRKYQKPFSTFFLSATIAALAIYWINLLLIEHFDAGDSQEALFFHKYWVLLQVALLPVYALITYLFFIRSGYNYGEILVLQLYVFSFLFIMLLTIHLFKFAFPHLKTRYIELPLIIVYTCITNLHFFKKLGKGLIIILTIITITLSFLMASTVQDLLVRYFSH